MAFDINDHFPKAVAANVRLWRQRIIVEARTADRWREQHEAIWKAVEAGLLYDLVQIEAAALAVDLLPTLERWGVWLNWLPLLETAKTFELPPDLHIRLLLVQGRLHGLNRNFRDAVRHLEVALSLAREHQVVTLAALAHYRLTNAYLGSKSYPQAREHGTAALDLLAPEQIETQAALYNSLGLIELETGAFAESEALLQQALALWRNLDEPTQLARTYLNLGAAYHQQSRWAEAKACYEGANAALSATDSVVDKLKVLNGLGALQFMAKELPAAEVTFRQGVTTAQKLQGMFHLRGSLTHNLGNTLLALGRLVEARGYLEKSIVLWQQANDPIEQANSMGTLGELFEAQLGWVSAVSCYEQALDLLAAYPDHSWAQKLVTQFQVAQARCAVQADPTSGQAETTHPV